jgi:hypothetical protein
MARKLLPGMVSGELHTRITPAEEWCTLFILVLLGCVAPLLKVFLGSPSLRISHTCLTRSQFASRLNRLPRATKIQKCKDAGSTFIFRARDVDGGGGC